MASMGLGWAEFKSYLEEFGPNRERPERPSACPFCDGLRVWFDGWRSIFCLVLLDGSVHRCDEGLPLQRVVCAVCRISWTLRPAFLYPHREFQADVVEHACFAYLAEPEATYARTAEQHRCSPRSVWRWVGWLATVATVAPARVLLAKAERLSGAGQSAEMIPAAVPEDHAKAMSAERESALLDAFQTLCALAVWSRAQPVPPLDPSPLRFWLTERYRAFRELHRLTRSGPSPPMPRPRAAGPK